MVKHKTLAAGILLIFSLGLGACGNAENSNDHGSHDNSAEDSSQHSEMGHSGSGEVPDDLKKAESPTYEVGSTAIVKADHMDGMEGAEATISGAYDTTVYAVTYTPSGGGDKVQNHKWVIHEELDNAGSSPLETGDTATLNADHMSGMQGAEAEIVSAANTTVYMIDFENRDGVKITNHKWVTEDELSAP